MVRAINVFLVLGLLAACINFAPPAEAAAGSGGVKAVVSIPDNKPEVKMPVLLAPAAPSSLSAVAGNARIDLVWHDNSGGKVSFQIERRTSGNQYVTIKTVASGIVRFTDTAVQSGITCYYRVRAVMAGGRANTFSAYSNEVSAIVAPTVPPVEFTTREIILTGMAVAPVEFTTREIALTGMAVTPVQLTTREITLTGTGN